MRWAFVLAVWLCSLPASAQVIQTELSPPFYLYPGYIKEKGYTSLSLTSHSKLYRKKKMKISRSKEQVELLFDGQGNAEKMIYRRKGKRDTVPLGKNIYVIDGAVNKRQVELGNITVIFRSDGELQVQRDSAGRVIYTQQVNNRKETNTYITRKHFGYDSLDRPIRYDYFYAYIGFSEKKKAYDTIPLARSRFLFHYKANGCVGTIEEKYTTLQGNVTTTFYKITYRDNEIIIQSNEDPTPDLPEKYYGVLRRKVK
jgi:hypothetical protein